MSCRQDDIPRCLEGWIRGAGEREVCGLLLAAHAGGPPTAALQLDNVAADPRAAFRLDPLQLLRAYEEIEASGGVVRGLWHSHPAGPARASAADLAGRQAGWVHWLLVPRPGGGLERVEY